MTSKITDELAEEIAARWPEDKKALFRVVTGEALNDGHYINAYDLTDKLYAALQSLRSAHPAVRVKPLEWTGPDVNGDMHARSILCVYTIRESMGSLGHWLTEVGGYYPTREEAKAAAQADYERRTLSALSERVPWDNDPQAMNTIADEAERLDLE